MLRNVSVLAYFLVFPLEISFHYLLIQIFGRPKVPLRFFGKSLKRGHSGGITKLKAKIPHNSWQFSDQEEQTFPLCKFLLIPSWQKVGVTLYEAIPIHNILSRKTQKLECSIFQNDFITDSWEPQICLLLRPLIVLDWMLLLSHYF